LPLLYKLLNCTKFGQLILRKIIKIIPTRYQILRLKCTKFDFSWGSAPDPAVGALQRSPDPLAGFKRPLRGRKGKRKGKRKGWGKEGRWMGRDGKGGEEEGKGKKGKGRRMEGRKVDRGKRRNGRQHGMGRGGKGEGKGRREERAYKPPPAKNSITGAVTATVSNLVQLQSSTAFWSGIPYPVEQLSIRKIPLNYI